MCLRASINFHGGRIDGAQLGRIPALGPDFISETALRSAASAISRATHNSSIVWGDASPISF